MSSYRNNAHIRLLVSTAMLITMASILHIIEGMLPPIPVTGARLGLANIITVAAIVMFGPKTAFSVAAGRTILGSLFSTGIVSPGFAMSFSGAMLSWAVMALLYFLAKDSFSLVGLSLVGAIAHNLAQLFVASLILENIGTFALFPFLMIFAIPTGIMVGLAAGFLIRAMARVPNFKRR
jgi:heptaprenyl diphosphate synthase